MSFLTGLFVVILAGIGVAAITEISKAIIGRGASVKQLTDLKQRLEQQDAVLQEAQDTLTDQAAQLTELQERVDFAERVLAQARERPAPPAPPAPPVPPALPAPHRGAGQHRP